MGLAEYAVAQIGHVQDADWEQLIEGRIAWQGATGEAAARAGGGGGGGGGGADGAGAAAASPATVTTGEGEWRQVPTGGTRSLAKQLGTTPQSRQ